MKSKSIKLLLACGALVLLIQGCGTSMSGLVVMPDGSKLKALNVIVYTTPRTDTVRVGDDGSFKISKNVFDEYQYTLIAEDKDGNAGYVRNYTTKKGPNPNIILRLSREVDGKEAVMEGDPSLIEPTGAGEKIFKSAQ